MIYGTIRYLGIFFILIILSSCFDNISEEKITGTWKAANIIEIQAENPAMQEMMEEMARKMFISEGYILNFFPDKVYSDVSGYNLDTGKWVLEDNKLLKFGENKLIIDKTEEKKKKRYLTGTIVLPDTDMKLKIEFVKVGDKLPDYKKDPYYPENNKWRIKPIHPETDNEIIDRLLNYIKHFAYIFKAGDIRKNKNVSWHHSSGVIRVYGNGVGTIDFDKINKNWINCFYDEKEAYKAYEIYRNSFKRVSYNAGDSKSRFLNTYNILMVVHDAIKYSPNF